MTTSQAYVVGKLNELTWRGLDPVHCEDASCDFTHEQVKRRDAYIDGVAHDHTGRGPIRVDAWLHIEAEHAPMSRASGLEVSPRWCGPLIRSRAEHGKEGPHSGEPPTAHFLP